MAFIYEEVTGSHPPHPLWLRNGNGYAVGYYKPDGEFVCEAFFPYKTRGLSGFKPNPESRAEAQEAASERCSYLNGGEHFDVARQRREVVTDAERKRQEVENHRGHYKRNPQCKLCH